MNKRLITIVSLSVLLAACEDDSQRSEQGGGPGSADPNNIIAGDGFCSPTGGASALGDPSYTSSSTAKIDTDGNPAMQGKDSDWRPDTSGQVNGHSVNSAQYAYVVMSKDQMAASGVSLGDWALVTNNATGQSSWARVEDVGPGGGTGEISQAAATGVGIQYQDNGFTVGDPPVTVNAYAGTAAIQGDCPTNIASS
jgi:hypothetical protein